MHAFLNSGCFFPKYAAKARGFVTIKKKGGIFNKMRFSLFRVVSGVLQFFAWVWMILLLVAGIIIVAVPIPWESLNYYGMDYNLQMGLYIFGWARWGVFIGMIVSALIGWAALMAIAGMLRLLISIETNTYQSANRAPLAYPPPAYMAPPMPSPSVYAPSPIPPAAPTLGVVPPPAAPTYPYSNCGAELLPGDKFCQNCGAKTTT
jgi:hypothetical protein